MKIALAQMDIVWEDPVANLKKINGFISDASSHGCDLIIFPEMATSGFSMDVDKIGETINGDSVKNLANHCVKFQINILIGLSIFDDTLKKGANSALFFNRDGEIKGEFIKLHPFSFAGEDEHYKFGESTIVFDVDDISASVFICYDLRFPEVFRSVAKDVQVIFVIANWPASRIEHWTALLRARAIENQAFVVGVNRVGTDGNDLAYNGKSAIIEPGGEIVLDAGTKEELLIGNIDEGSVSSLRKRLPFLDDIKED